MRGPPNSFTSARRSTAMLTARRTRTSLKGARRVFIGRNHSANAGLRWTWLA